jgi:hypothetical protein
MIEWEFQSLVTPPEEFQALTVFALLAIASFIIHYLGWQAKRAARLPVRNGDSSGLPPRNAPNGIPRPRRVYRYLCGETSQKPISGPE